MILARDLRSFNAVLTPPSSNLEGLLLSAQVPMALLSQAGLSMEHCPSLHSSIPSALWPQILPAFKDLEEINSFNEKCEEHYLDLQPSIMSATAVTAAV